MAVTLPPSGYMSDSTRTKGEMKTSFEELRDAIDVVDTNADDNTTNITGLTSDVADIEVALDAHIADSGIHVTSAEKTKLVYSPTFISNQTEFDAIFDGSTLSNVDIYIVFIGTPYILNNEIPFGSNLTINSDQGVFIERGGQYRFHSTGTVGTYVKNVHFTDRWTFDGLRATYTYTGSGGFAELSYTEDCKFETFVIDCLVNGDGGAYSSVTDTTDKNTIRNILNCESNTNGGGVYNCDKSIISNISTCIALLGGGVYASDDSDISNITNCFASTATSGAGVYGCDSCTITKIFSNGIGCGVAECTNCVISMIYSNTDDGCYGCDNCTINNVYSNIDHGCYDCDNCTISNINDNGRGCFGCDNCTINDVYDNTSEGVNNCDDSSISNVFNNTYGVIGCDRSKIDTVHDNSRSGCWQNQQCLISNVFNNSESTTAAGGCNDCDDCVFTGLFTGNTSTGGAYDQISGSDTSIAFVIDSAAAVLISTVRGTINF